MEIKIKKITFEVDSEFLDQFLGILRFYIGSHGLQRKFKYFDNVDLILQALGLTNKEIENFIELAQKRRIWHVNWLCFDNEMHDTPKGQLILPASMEELAELLKNYDLDWTGFDKE